MKCPNCGECNVELGADGKVYCPQCMVEVEGLEYSLHKDKVIEHLEDFLEAIDPDDRADALEFLQEWIDQKAEEC